MASTEDGVVEVVRVFRKSGRQKLSFDETYDNRFKSVITLDRWQSFCKDIDHMNVESAKGWILFNWVVPFVVVVFGWPNVVMPFVIVLLIVVALAGLSFEREMALIWCLVWGFISVGMVVMVILCNCAWVSAVKNRSFPFCRKLENEIGSSRISISVQPGPGTDEPLQLSFKIYDCGQSTDPGFQALTPSGVASSPPSYHDNNEMTPLLQMKSGESLTTEGMLFPISSSS